jgi:hypothetical protein
MSVLTLQDLEETVASLLASALALPAGRDRDGAIREIEGYRARIAALRHVEARLAEVGLRKNPDGR